MTYQDPPRSPLMNSYRVLVVGLVRVLCVMGIALIEMTIGHYTGFGDSPIVSSQRWVRMLSSSCSNMYAASRLTARPTRTRGKRYADYKHRSRAPVGVNVGCHDLLRRSHR